MKQNCECKQEFCIFAKSTFKNAHIEKLGKKILFRVKVEKPSREYAEDALLALAHVSRIRLAIKSLARTGVTDKVYPNMVMQCSCGILWSVFFVWMYNADVNHFSRRK